ncbi:MAG: hypothetical protein FJ086_15545 [Deltaproteobacteria bacterium]|nr:hypothetical protein [Deltaproteobacteria bacterium]
MTVLAFPLLRAGATGPLREPWELAEALVECLRAAHGLPPDAGTWASTPPEEAWKGEEASDRTLSPAPGRSVRCAYGAQSLWDPGQYHQHYRVWLSGCPGAHFGASGDTSDVHARAPIEAESPAAALTLWKALRGALPRRGWRELALLDPTASAALRVLAAEAGTVLAWDVLEEKSYRAIGAFALRGLDGNGRLDLRESLPMPITGKALGALLASPPPGTVRALRLPPGLHPAPAGADGALATLQELEGAFVQTPRAAALAGLTALKWSSQLPGDAATYPWDELAGLQSLELSASTPVQLPGALWLSRSLRHVRLSLCQPLSLPSTAAVSPLRLRRLEVALGGRPLSLPDGALPSAHTLEALDLGFTQLPEGLPGPLPHLRWLKLWDNGLRCLPPALSGCAGLEELHVLSNPLTSLAGLAALPRLRAVTLVRTGLTGWPAELESLPALEELELTLPDITREQVMERLPRLKKLVLSPR